jgi:hypothetical protein
MDKVFGPITGALLVAALAGIVQAIKTQFKPPVFVLWVIDLGLSLVFVGGGTLYFSDVVTWRVIFEAVVYSILAALSVVGFWNVTSNLAGRRVIDRAG